MPGTNRVHPRDCRATVRSIHYPRLFSFAPSRSSGLRVFLVHLRRFYEQQYPIPARPGNHRSPTRSRRHEPVLRVKQAFERYQNLSRWSLVEILATFSLAELSLIADALNGIMFTNFEVEPAPQLQIELGGLDGSYFKKWKVEAISFHLRLDSLTNAQAAALIESIDRWWRDSDRKLTTAGFAKHGLIAMEVENE